MNEAPLPEPDIASLQAEIARLKKMVTALMDRSERAMSGHGSEFGLFQTTITLENQVRERTQALEAALAENEKITRVLESEKEEQRVLIGKLENAHNQLLQSEKLASIGHLAAGIAHEINNPIGFVNSNLGTLKNYIDTLIEIIAIYERMPDGLEQSAIYQNTIEQMRRDFDLEFLREDVVNLINESIEGTARVKRIVQDLRDFSRIGSEDWAWTHLHEGLDSTLNMLANELRVKAEVLREYGVIPQVECIPSQINQVFMNILMNAIQAISEHGVITIRSGCVDETVWISVSDNGKGIPPEILPKVFDPFFTTQSIGAGTGLGLSVAYGIIKHHFGEIEVKSTPEQGATFTIHLPIRHHR